MPDGKTHERLVLKTLPLAVFFGGLAAGAGHDVAVLATPLGHAMGVIMTPDLDLRVRTRAERLLERGALLTWPLIIMSGLYARVFGGGRWPFVHRGISHWPVIGTATRWLWFGWPVVAITSLRARHIASQA